MHFAYPQHAWWWLAVAGCVALAVVGLLRQRRAQNHFGSRAYGLSGQATFSWPRQVLKAALRCAAFLLLGIVVLGPYWSEEEQPPLPTKGRDLMVLLDVSRSMLAEDAQPSRLGQAKRQIQQLADHLEQIGGYRLGLMAFADRAAVLCPLTTDYRHFHEELGEASLENLRMRRETPSGVEGTVFGIALQRAEKALPRTPDSQGGNAENHCDLLIVSDGGGQLDDDVRAVAERLKARGVRIFTIGVGDPQSGAKIPVFHANGRREYLQFQGEEVRTRLEEPVLRQLAELTAGAYHQSASGDWRSGLIDTLAGSVQRELVPAGGRQNPIHRYEWFLIPAIVLLLADCLIGTRRSRPAGSREVPMSAGQMWLYRLVPPGAARKSAARTAQERM